jgi:hypothetical protein
MISEEFVIFGDFVHKHTPIKQNQKGLNGTGFAAFFYRNHKFFKPRRIGGGISGLEWSQPGGENP